MSEDPTPYGNHSEITELRLQLHREKLRADAFEQALRKEVLAIINSAAKDEINSELMQKDEELEACYQLIEEIKASALELAKHLPDNPKAKKALADFKKSYDLP